MAQKSSAPGLGEMFLKVEGAKFGKIKGEVQADGHVDEIEVLRWSWGMQARPSLEGGSASGRASINDLKIVKRVDRASAPLMQALRTNESIKATLTVRKAGANPVAYLKILIEQGRVTALTIEAGDLAGGPDVFENVAFSFNKITVDYVPQAKDGSAMGTVTYVDQWSNP